jgi:hypothetical protein
MVSMYLFKIVRRHTNSKEVCMHYVEVKYLELIKIEKSVNH